MEDVLKRKQEIIPTNPAEFIARHDLHHLRDHIVALIWPENQSSGGQIPGENENNLGH